MRIPVTLLASVGALIVTVDLKAWVDEPVGELEGRWSVVTVTMNGVKATERVAGRRTITVHGNKMTVKPGVSVDGNGKVEPGNADGDEATFTLDPTKSPAQINLTFGSGKNR